VVGVADRGVELGEEVPVPVDLGGRLVEPSLDEAGVQHDLVHAHRRASLPGRELPVRPPSTRTSALSTPPFSPGHATTSLDRPTTSLDRPSCVCSAMPNGPRQFHICFGDVTS